jgi:hypothetical protein
MTPWIHRLGTVLCTLVLGIGCAPVSRPANQPATSRPAAADHAERRARRAEGMAAYHRKDWATCATRFEQALDLYSAACCHAQAGALDRSFALLARAIDDGLRDQALEKDDDLAPLHADPRWQRALDHLATKTAAHRKLLNAELTQL